MVLVGDAVRGADTAAVWDTGPRGRAAHPAGVSRGASTASEGRKEAGSRDRSTRRKPLLKRQQRCIWQRIYREVIADFIRLGKPGASVPFPI
jgi:hypothetical protein